jgi:hypothetical protein
MIDFKKTIYPDFDRVEITARQGSDWLSIEMHVGCGDERIKMNLRSLEAAADLHYALGRYLEWRKSNGRAG